MRGDIGGNAPSPLFMQRGEREARARELMKVERSRVEALHIQMHIKNESCDYSFFMYLNQNVSAKIAQSMMPNRMV